MIFFFMLWFVIQVFSFALLPLSFTLFSKLPDKGYSLSKTFGLLLVGFLVWFLGSLRLCVFSWGTIMFVVLLLGIVSWWWLSKSYKFYFSSQFNWKTVLLYICMVEVLFVVVLAIFTLLRSMNPAIQATEKPMDFAFMNAIARSQFFPPNDPWFAHGTINYYYFGHCLIALVAVFSGIPMKIMYNLGLALVFSLAFINIFGIGFNAVSLLKKQLLGSEPAEPVQIKKVWNQYKEPLVIGILGALFVLVCSNFDTVLQLIVDFKQTLSTSWWQGIGWNASRVVGRGVDPEGYITINEFPYFSFILGDMHAHVIALSLVTLCTGLILSWSTKTLPALVTKTKQIPELLANYFSFSYSEKLPKEQLGIFGLEGVLIAVISAIILGSLAVTNLWDFPVFGFLLGLVIALSFFKQAKKQLHGIGQAIVVFFPLGLLAIVAYLPFFLNFETIKAVGDPKPLLNLIFNVADIGRRTELEELLIVWGLFLVIILLGLVVWNVYGNHKDNPSTPKTTLSFSPTEIFFLIVIPLILAVPLLSVVVWLVSFLLIGLVIVGLKLPSCPGRNFSLASLVTGLWLVLASELIYINDFFGPPRERMNTVFKFYYQAWILLGIGCAIVLWIVWERLRKNISVRYAVAMSIGLLFLGSLVYPLVATPARFRDFSSAVQGLDGIKFMEVSASTGQRADWDASEWINHHVAGAPVLVEAIKDQSGRNSYSDAARISALTGLPAVLGWYSSHENLWRNSDPEISQRAAAIDQMYQTDDLELTKQLLQKYQVQYVYVGEMEHQVYPDGKFSKFEELGTVVYKNEKSKLYRVMNFTESSVQKVELETSS